MLVDAPVRGDIGSQLQVKAARGSGQQGLL